MRATFVPTRFHCFLGLGSADDRVYIYVLEHKSLAGREDIPDDDAQACPLEVCFFKKAQDSPPGELHVTRLDHTTGGAGNAHLQPCTDPGR